LVIVAYVPFLPVAVKVVLVVAVLFVCGEYIRRANRLHGSHGLYMLSGKWGISAIGKAASRAPQAWNFMADWGLTIGFGLAAYLIAGRKINRKAMAVGMLTLILVPLLIIPESAVPINFITLPQLQARMASYYSCIVLPGHAAGSAAGSGASGGANYAQYAVWAIILLLGLAGLVPFLLLYNAAVILMSVISSLSVSVSSAYGAINAQVPGVAPLIPGITLPFLAGIVSLAIILVVHEASHGILSRVAGVKIRKTGLILFGIIPVGAFVDPDERALNRLKKIEQHRIFIAGIAANMLFALIFLVVMMLLGTYALPYVLQHSVVVEATVANSPACNVISPGSLLLGVNGHAVGNITNLGKIERGIPPGSKITVETNNGNYSLNTNSSGKIGVLLLPQSITAPKPGALDGLVYFVYVVAALSFLLNFSLAAVNLLPLLGLDGWRIFYIAFGRRRKAVLALQLLLIAALIINALPLITSII
jgi:membrane-associated protease RseP (regulator of RpoE activity)